MAWRVLGIGSPFGDDQVGWRLVADLGALGVATGWDCTALALDRPGTGLIHAMAGAQGVILVDALENRGKPGCIHSLSVDDLMQCDNRFSSHGFGVAEALGLAVELGLLPPHFMILGVEMSEGPLADGISPAVAAALPALCSRVTTVLSAWRSEQPGLTKEVKTCV
ncbi:hydrogenase maturation protease [Marinobacter sp.]|uniref:hydrogenase maturation protease n=1 Tax=Marinobacter sp. TaxID=50741 RepID=UPI00384EB67B